MHIFYQTELKREKLNKKWAQTLMIYLNWVIAQMAGMEHVHRKITEKERHNEQLNVGSTWLSG